MRTLTVAVLPDQVISYLKDFANAEQWDPGTQRCSRIDDGPIDVGASWHNISKILGFTTELTYKLEELTDRKIVFVGTNGSATDRETITVDRAGDGSTIRYEAKLTMHGVGRLLRPAMKIVFEKLANDTEKQLSRVLNERGNKAQT